MTLKLLIKGPIDIYGNTGPGNESLVLQKFVMPP